MLHKMAILIENKVFLDTRIWTNLDLIYSAVKVWRPLVIPSAYAHFGVMARPVLLPVVGVVAAIYAASVAFVGAPQGAPRVSRVPARVSAEYLERLGPKDSDVPFDAGQATGPGASVEFKKRPFGILRYQPG